MLSSKELVFVKDPRYKTLILYFIIFVYLSHNTHIVMYVETKISIPEQNAGPSHIIFSGRRWCQILQSKKKGSTV